MLDFSLLESFLGASLPGGPVSGSIWTDPHISRRLLAAHLDPDTDAASRRPAAIEATLAWIARQVGPAPLDVLDLGCGPGLYSERLASAGHRVVGLDFSQTSLDYARGSAESQGLAVDYREADYLEEGLGGPYGLVAMIYCDLGALDRDRRRELLAKVRGALAPGGAFVFDVVDERFLAQARLGRDWAIAGPGFWSPEPYLLWEDTRHLPAERSVVRSYVVAEPGSGRVRRYEIRDTYFSDEDVRAELAEAGLRLELSDRGVLPAGSFKEIEPVFHLARAV